MRRFTFLFSMLALSAAVHAQTVATFDDLALSKPDTSYINYSASGTDVGFNDGLAHFPCVYDTAYGGYWDYGFSYSNWTDSVTSGYENQYSAKTAIGYDSSSIYTVAYGITNTLNLKGAAAHEKVMGFFVTNSTYAFNSMLYGDAPPAKKFGGSTGNDPDWFLLTIKGYSADALTADSVNFYLADYRFAANDSDYIVRTWQWVNLLPLGAVDSLQFTLNSSDTAGGYGMNTPAYFCMDNFTTDETNESVKQVASTVAAKVYPNPAANMLNVDITDNTASLITITDMSGNVINTYQVTAAHTVINTAAFAPGTYILQLSGNGKSGSIRFVKD